MKFSELKHSMLPSVNSNSKIREIMKKELIIAYDLISKEIQTENNESAMKAVVRGKVDKLDKLSNEELIQEFILTMAVKAWDECTKKA